MGRTKKQTKTQIAAKAKAAAKRMTRGKIAKVVALAGPAIDRGLSYMSNKNPREVTYGIPQDYTGIDFNTGQWDGERMARGLAANFVQKGETALFKMVGVPPPTLRPKGFKGGLRMVAYEGAAALNAYGGSSRQDKYRRWFHSHYGVNLNRTDMGAIDIMKPVVEKWFPYITLCKVLQMVK